MNRLRQHYPLIYKTARSHSLSPKVVAAMVQVESGGDRWASREEPHLIESWGESVQGYVESLGNPLAAHHYNNISKGTWLASYGLLQILWPVAYERGYRNPWPSSLCAAYNGLEYGCRQLVWLGQRTKNEDEMIGAYNGGLGNPRPEYAAKVRRAMEDLSDNWWD